MNLSDISSALTAQTRSPLLEPTNRPDTEIRRLNQLVAFQGGLIYRHRDAIIRNIVIEVQALLDQDPELKKALAKRLSSKKPPNIEFLNSVALTISRINISERYNIDTEDAKEFVVVDPYKNLRVLLMDFSFLANQPSTLASLEEKVDLESILADLEQGGTSNLYYIGHGIWVTGRVLFEITYQLLRLTAITLRVTGNVLNNTMTRNILTLAIRILQGG